MKKQFISALMAATISLNLLACGSNNANESESIPDIAETETIDIVTESEQKPKQFRMK